MADVRHHLPRTEVRRAGKGCRSRASDRAAQRRSDPEQRRDLRQHLSRSSGALYGARAGGAAPAAGPRQSTALSQYLDQAAVSPACAAATGADAAPRVEIQKIPSDMTASTAAARNAAPGTWTAEAGDVKRANMCAIIGGPT